MPREASLPRPGCGRRWQAWPKGQGEEGAGGWVGQRCFLSGADPERPPTSHTASGGGRGVRSIALPAPTGLTGSVGRPPQEGKASSPPVEGLLEKVSGSALSVALPPSGKGRARWPSGSARLYKSASRVLRAACDPGGSRSRRRRERELEIMQVKYRLCSLHFYKCLVGILSRESCHF